MEEPHPFTQFLVEQRQGGLHGDLSESLQQLVAAVEEHGKAGTLTLTIRVTPTSKGASTYFVTDDVKVKKPEADRGASLFFSDGHGNLSRTDPRQPELPLREVPAPEPTAIREAPQT